MSEKTYHIAKFGKQRSDSPGIAAGMWAVIETTEKPVAFFDTKEHAERFELILKALIAQEVQP